MMTRAHAFFSLLALSLAAACGGTVSDDRAALGPGEHHPRFAGFWMVDEAVARSGYSAVIFELGSRGTLARRQGVEYSGSIEALGSIQNPGRSATCGFGPSWRSVGASLLVIETKCSDGRHRELTLELTNDASTDVSGASVRIIDAGGEAGWEMPRPWGWKMQKCVTEQSCLAKWR